uniref:Uncharacterized protein n=1 Tax=Manihot esculenta TaxID=3983 RepID=A0A2C9W786_MANES
MRAILTQDFWAEVSSTTSYLVNCSPFTLIGCKTSKEVWSNSPTSYPNLLMFNCPIYVHFNDEKLKPRSEKSIFIDCSHSIKGYKV